VFIRKRKGNYRAKVSERISLVKGVKGGFVQKGSRSKREGGKKLGSSKRKVQQKREEEKE